MVKNWTACAQMAAALSMAYRAPLTSFAPFADSRIDNGGNMGPNSTLLLEYWNDHGILFTMCPDDKECGVTHSSWLLPRHENHLSASWIHENRTGLSRRFMGTMGLVLDPQYMASQDNDKVGQTVQCLYPIDGITAGRAQNGCGIPRAPGLWPTIQQRLFWKQIKQEHFPDTAWNDIDCADLFEFQHFKPPPNTQPHGMTAEPGRPRRPPPPGGPPLGIPPNATIVSVDCQHLDNVTAFTFTSHIVALKDALEKIMGHVACQVNPHDRIPKFGETVVLIYNAPCSWDASWEGWESMNKAMVHFEQLHPHAHMWNEIVLRPPKKRDTWKNWVKAVFYTEESGAEQAHQQARILGGKHVLRMKANDDDYMEPLFQCDNNPEPSSVNGE